LRQTAGRFRGTLIARAGLNNQGHVALSSGISDVYGDVVNNTGNAAVGITVSGQADVTFWDDVTNTSGLFRVSADSSATFFGNFSGGGISGTGDVYFESDITPGSSPGLATIGGNVHLGDLATYQVELAGSAGTQYDKLDVNGALALGGALNVSLINGFTPAVGNSFDILDWGALSGTFNALQLPTLGSGLAWNTSQLYSTGVLSVSAAGIPGDYNNNGTVDAGDYVLWRKHNNTSTTLPNDSTPGTDPSDFNVWRAHFSQTAGGGAGAAGSAAVPEPGTFVLLLTAACWCSRRSRLHTKSQQLISD
jgi:hypothetical protein